MVLSNDAWMPKTLSIDDLALFTIDDFWKPNLGSGLKSS